MLFAKRKRNLFKGPMLSLGGGRDNRSNGSGSASHSRSASASGLGRRSGEATIQEADEDAEGLGEEEEEVEEVDAFSPIVKGPGEVVEEKIYEEGEDEGQDTLPDLTLRAAAAGVVNAAMTNQPIPVGVNHG